MTKTFDFLKEDDRFYFDIEAVGRVVRFIETHCKLNKEHEGLPFKLLPWQLQIVSDVFGWKWKDTDRRRFRIVYIEVPRKNGKTFFVAALLLYLLMADGAKGAEILAAACTSDQSGLLYDYILDMIDQNKEFFEERIRSVPYLNELFYDKTKSYLKALSGDSKGKHGTYPSVVACDELHEWEGKTATLLYSALTTGFGSRKNPLVIHITTAGFGSQQTIAKRLHERSKKFAEGQETNPAFYGVVYGADLEDDWTSEETWKKANPSYEIRADNLKAEFLEAQADTAGENDFRRLYLNQWTQQQTRFLDMEVWKNCVKPLKFEDFKKRDVILGLDLGQTYDLTAVSTLVLDKDGPWTLFNQCFMPSQQVERRTLEDDIPYKTWADPKKGGFIIPTYGKAKGISTDYEAITAYILELSKEYNILYVGYDPSGAAPVVNELEDKGIAAMNINQRPADMNDGTKEFQRRQITGEMVIAENPCLTWQAGNVEIRYDEQGRIRPVKPNAAGKYAGTAKYKVDGITAACIAAQTVMLTYRPEDKKPEKAKVGVFFVKR